MRPFRRNKGRASLKIGEGRFFSHILYALFAYLAFAPCLLTGRSYFANDLLYYYGPMRAYLRDQWAHGQFPLWNPYLFGGQPFFADPNTMMAYPPNFPTLLFPVGIGLTLFMAAHLFLSACGMHFWLGTLGLSDSSRRLGSLLYALSGFFWVELIHPPVLAAYAWLPWLAGCLERWIQTKKGTWAFAAGSAFALLFLSGSQQIALAGLYMGFLYFLARWITAESGENPRNRAPRMDSLKKGGRFLVLAAWGAVPVLFQCVPTLEFLKLSTRPAEEKSYSNFGSEFSMRPRTLYQFLYPSAGLRKNEPLEYSLQHIEGSADVPTLANCGYLGLWAPVLMAMAFFGRQRKAAALFGFLGLLVLLTALGKYFPLHRWLYEGLPGFGFFRSPYRLIGIYTLFGSALAAMGYEALKDRLGGNRPPAPMLLALGGYGVLSVAGLVLFSPNHGGGSIREMAAALIGAAAVYFWRRGGGWKKFGAFAFQAGLVAPLLVYGWTLWTPGANRNYDFKTNSIVPGIFEPGLKRILIGPSAPYYLRLEQKEFTTPFPQNAPLPLKIRSMDGYNPLMLSRTRDLSTLPFPTQRRLMALGGILSGTPLSGTEGMDHQKLGELYLYFTSQPPDYLFAPEDWKVAGSQLEEWKDMSDPAFDPAALAVLEGPLPDPVPTGGEPGKRTLTCQVQRDEPEAQTFLIRQDKPGWVVFSEIHYPGWKAWVDTQSAPLVTANHAFRALWLPAGSHLVDFRFEPAYVLPLLLLMAVWLLSVIIYGVKTFA